MKVLSKEEEDAHYGAVLRGGAYGGFAGLALGLGANALMYRRMAFYRSLTIPLRAFFVSSTATFGAIIEADRYSRHFEEARTASDRYLLESRARQLAEERANQTKWERAMSLGKEYRYSIVTASWAASMAGSLAMVSRDKYLTTSQKLVQARMYAQGLTLLILVATAAFEVSDARAAKQNANSADPKKRIHHETYVGEDLWKDMVEAEEKRDAARRAAAAEKLKH
ncbi:mitochondrial hypoxia responsive domain-containing protein [Tricharina praecox]|uniref:mitochondrial hypoxia responsive domain-containing protein n=1 Tax=Tricharina praecox TaxID=43433 RepID=UPI002220827C|nr:mitochondrial hypoxia responsive domain-containing protein [Tricharina praecox]KAI5852126.1 mitochondrial hypoxia responsive domain-containing protein [Tricharina praecox]